jgi:TonB-linked SusC/RagA family outer membrane protein
MRKLIFLVTCLLFVGFSASAQVQISGKVTNAETGDVIPGVSVVVKDQTTIGTSTDMDGNYSLQVPSDAETLVFSFVGMQAAEVPIQGRTTINVELQPSIEEMEEVVVVGYGTRSKKNLTTAVSKIESQELQETSEPSIDGALQGHTAGVTVNRNSGAPGQGISVRIRGVTTVSGSNQPLYVVDGIPVVNATTTTDSYGGQRGNALTNLAPSDIESVEILKDAAASAIYGARASNGVVLITTKQGKKGDVEINFNMSYGVQNPIERYKTMAVGNYFKFADKAFSTALPYSSYWSYAKGWVSDPNATPESSEDLQNLYANNLSGFDREVTDYLDAVYKQDVPIWEASLNVRGGNESTTYYLGVSNVDQEGVLVGQDYNRKSLRFNVNQKATDWLDVFAKVNYSLEEVNRINNDNNIFGVLSTGLLESPGVPVYDDEGNFTTSGFTFSNPVQMAHVVDGVSDNSRIVGNMGFNAGIIEGLTFKSVLNLDRLDFRERRYIPATTSWGSTYNGKGFLATDDYFKWLTTNQLNYIHDFGDLTVNALAAIEYQDYKRTYNHAEADNYPTPDMRWPYSGSELSTTYGNPGYQTENKLFSAISRLSLDYADKYLLQMALRADASSKFGKENRTGYFPSVSAGWKLHNEAFFDVSAINELKLRGSYGVTGNESGIGDFTSLTVASAQAYGDFSGIHVTRLGDANLSWEETSQVNVGFDLGLFDDRIHLEYQYFNKKTTNLLLSKPLPGSTGFTSILSNVGEMENSGHEIMLNANIVEGEFNWTTTFNFSTLNNEITKLYQKQPIDRGFVSRVAVGQALGAYYVFETYDKDGNGTILDENGDVEYKDRNGDGVLTDDDKYFAGKPLADYSGNFRNVFSYEGVSLSVNFNYKLGREMYNNTLAFAGASGSPVFGKLSSQTDYWTENNKDTNMPRPAYGAAQSNNNRDSDRFVEDGSYIRLQNITLSYNLPEKWLNNTKLRLFVGADNLVTWTDYTGLDPEVNAFGTANVATGTEFLSQGLNKTYKAGLNLTF